MTLWLPAEDWQALWLTLWVAVWTVALGAPLALGVAFALARRRFAGRGLLNLLVHLPLVLPPVVTGYALLVAFGQRGVVGGFLEQSLGLVLSFRWTGAVLAAVVMAFPLMVRPMRQALEAVNPRIEEMATSLGAGPWVVWRTVTLPLILPGIVIGAVMGFAKALGEFGATITFVAAIPGQTRTIASAVNAYLAVPGQEAAVLRLVALSLALSVLALALAEGLGRWAARRIAGQGA
ncbi:MAG: molybdate ABC transporter permease subunit [Paracoccaceae bacterium]